MSSLSKLRSLKKPDNKKAEKSEQKSQKQNQPRPTPTPDSRPEYLRSVVKLMNDRPHISKSHNAWLESLMAAMLGQKEFEEDASVLSRLSGSKFRSRNSAKTHK